MTIIDREPTIVLRSLCSIAVLLGVGFTQSGCMCISGLNYLSIGRTHAEIQLGDAYLDPDGNLYIEAQLVRVDGPGNTEPLGTRYVIAPAPSLRKTIEDAMVASASVSPALTYPFLMNTRREQLAAPATSEEARSVEAWYLYPADLFEPMDRPELPPHLQSRDWHKCQQIMPAVYALPHSIPGEPCALAVRPSLEEMPGASHRAWWAYPTDLLYVPAAVVDAALFPFLAIGILVFPPSGN